ncbi:MAG TPA: FAD:protein FMN transferase [Candidatus Limnocylindria bacterium]
MPYRASGLRREDLLANRRRTGRRHLSRFFPNSELSRVNRLAGSGTAFIPGRRLRRLLTTASRAQRITHGRFDPRVITALEAIGERAGVPLPLGDDDAAASSEPHWLHRDSANRTFRISVPVDSGGLGKGLGLRCGR